MTTAPAAGQEQALRRTPFYDKQSRMNLGVLSSRTDQCFGVWSGEFDGVRFDGIEGFAEDVHNRW